MKIVYITRELPPSRRCGGIGSYVWDTAKGLATQGHQVTIVAASDDIFTNSDSVIDGVRVIRLNGADFYLPRNNNRYLRTLGSRIRERLCFKSYRRKINNTLQDLISSDNADIVEFAEYGDEAHVWLRLPKREIPTIIRLHGPEGHDRNSNTIDTSRKSIREHLATTFMADAITSPSAEMVDTLKANEFASILLNKYKKLIKILPNSIDCLTWKTNIISKKNKPYVIFSAGSVCDQKGYGELAEAVKMLRQKGHDVTLQIAGKLGALGIKLKNLSKKNTDYQNWLNILGPVNREDLKKHYAQADIVCLPSWWDTFNLVCTEAMASGAIVVGSSRSGMAEIIEESKDGFLVAPKDSKLLADKLEEVLCLPASKKDRIRQNAQEKIRNKFDNEVVLRQLTAFYNEVIDQFKANI